MNQFDYRASILKRLHKISLELEACADADKYEVAAELDVIKKLAYEIDDFEVLGLATKLEMKYKHIFEYDYYSAADDIFQNGHTINHLTRDNNYTEFYLRIHSTLFENDNYVVDMKHYREEVERHKEALVASGIYANLSRYVDDKTATNKAFQKVKSELSKHRKDDGKYMLPTEDEIVKEFESARNDIYRLANKHVASQIEASVEHS